MIYDSDGYVRITVVDGNTRTGLQASDGSINVVLNDGDVLGVQHPCGALNAVEVQEMPSSVLSPNGSLYVIETEDGYVSYSSSKDFPTPVVPFDPSSLSPILWLEPSKGGMFQSSAGTTEADTDGDVVGYLPDFSGNEKHYTSEADNTTRPTLQGVGTLPCIRFDGVNDFLRREESLGLLEAGKYTIALSFKSNTPSVDARLFTEGNSANNNTLFISIQAGNPTATTSTALYRNDAGLQLVAPSSMANANVFDNESHVFVLTDDGTFIRSYVDGEDGASTGWTPSGTFTLDRSSLGCLLRASSGNWWSGDVYGMVVIDKVLSEEERTNLTSYLGSLAGLSL